MARLYGLKNGRSNSNVGMEQSGRSAHHRRVTRKTEKELWPAWSNWALLAVVVTSLLTIAATLNDIF